MIKVLEKADRVLRLVSEKPGIAFGELVGELGWHKATLSNILKTLTDLGYLERDADGSCRIGPTVASLASSEKRRRALPSLAEECARSVAQELRETVTVGKLLNGDRFNLAKATVDRTVSVDARVEIRYAPYNTATGRALLAFCEPQELEAVIAKHGLPGEAWDGIGSRRALEAALKAIREKGCAEICHGSAHSVAVPVRDADGRLVASVGAAVPMYRLEETGVETVRRVLRAAADQMAQELAESEG